MDAEARPCKELRDVWGQFSKSAEFSQLRERCADVGMQMSALERVFFTGAQAATEFASNSLGGASVVTEAAPELSEEDRRIKAMEDDLAGQFFAHVRELEVGGSFIVALTPVEGDPSKGNLMFSMMPMEAIGDEDPEYLNYNNG